MRKSCEITLNNSLFSKKDRLLLAFSGGVDSVVLAHVLKQNGIAFELAHCNFNLRGKESDMDEKFCSDFAKKNKLKIHIKQFDTKSYVKIKKLSVQMAARELRYHWFNELVQKNKFDYILTAHHANDNIETLLLNLARGTGLNGLVGIPFKQNNIIRPLLHVTKDAVLKFAESHKLKFRHDSSNDEVKYARNYLRHKIIPGLKKINPAIEHTLLHNMEFFRQAAEIVNEYCEEKKKEITTGENETLKISISKLLKKTASELLLHEILAPLGFNSSQISQIHQSINTKQSGKLFLSSGYQVLIDRDFILAQPIEESTEEEAVYEIKSASSFNKLPVKFKAEVVKKAEVIRDKNLGFFDYNLLQFPLTLRKWQKGDKFMPLGMQNFKKLSDYFISNKIPLSEKNKIWILLNGNDQIIWIVGHRIDERFKLTPSSKQILKLEFKNR